MYYHNLDEYEDWDAHVAVLKPSLGAANSKIEKAIGIVEKYHDQPRIFTKGNYNRHPVRVARILAEEMGISNETSILIALCHDLGEWSEYSISELKKEFGDKVYEGVEVLTWDQKGEWSDFVKSITSSNIDDLVAIKIADKLDNNRSVALSGSLEEKTKARNRTLEVILPLVQKYHPEMTSVFDEVLSRLD